MVLLCGGLQRELGGTPERVVLENVGFDTSGNYELSVEVAEESASGSSSSTYQQSQSLQVGGKHDKSYMLVAKDLARISRTKRKFYMSIHFSVTPMSLGNTVFSGELFNSFRRLRLPRL